MPAFAPDMRRNAHDLSHFPFAWILRRSAPVPYQIGEFRGLVCVMDIESSELRVADG